MKFFKEADSVFLNGNIYTLCESCPRASAIAVTDHKITYVGDDVGANAFIGENTTIMNLSRKTVLPGFIEGHMHMDNLGQSLMTINCFMKSKSDILLEVSKAAKDLNPGEWIQGRGWNNVLWEDSAYPSKEDLDAIAPDNPVFLVRADAHMAWINTKALLLAKITEATKDPLGGEILKNESGKVLGCLTDTAIPLVRSHIPIISSEKQKEALLLAQKQLFTYGITSVFDAGNTLAQIQNYHELYKEGALDIRVYPLLTLSSLESPEMEYIKSTPPTEEIYDNHMAVKCVKIIGDGSLGSRSSAMIEDYSDRPGHRGNYRFSDEELYKIMKTAYDAGYQIAFHAIGDGTNHQGIKIYEQILKENPRPNPRLRIEHFQILTDADLDKALSLKILPAMQPTHATSDMSMAEERIGSKRMKNAYAWRTVLDKGSIIIGGSDAPVELVNPYHGLYAAVTRMKRDGTPQGGWYPEQKMTREEALKSFTVWAAYGQFEERLKGTLERGMLADFVVIDRDYMTCPESEIKDIEALMTVLGGKAVYRRNS